MSTFIKNLKAAFTVSERQADSGSLVETILIISAFAVVAVLSVMWIGNAIAGQAHLMATYCINQSQDIAAQQAPASQATIEKCSGTRITDISIKQQNNIANTKQGRF